MAAHGLTIARQILAQPDENKVTYAKGSLSAPGWDVTLGAGGMGYFHLYSAAGDDNLEGVKAAAKELVGETIFLETYGIAHYDEYRKHVREHIRHGTPWYRKRWDAYYAGTLPSALAETTPESVAHVRNIVPDSTLAA